MVFYDQNGRQLQAFDYSSDEAARDLSCCAFNPSCDTAVVGAFNRLYVFSMSNSSGIWEHVAVKQVSRKCRRCWPAIPRQAVPRHAKFASGV